MNFTSTRKRLVTIGIAAGAVLGSAGIVSAVTNNSAATTPTTVDSAVPAAAPATGVDNSNSDPAHEAGESAQREADETAGRGGHGPGDGHHSNTDPAHEASESPARQAEEAAHDAQIGSSPDGTTATTGG